MRLPPGSPRLACALGLLFAACGRPAPATEVKAEPPAPSTSAAPPAPSGSASAATLVPSAAPTVDQAHCRPKPPAVRWEVKDDDVVRVFDAQGCSLAESSFQTNGYSYKASVDFMTQLQARLKARDKNGLADLMSFPLRVNRKGTGTAPLVVKDRAAFLAAFEQIFTKERSAAIVADDPRNLFCNYQGVMLGDGVVWFGNAGGHYGVVALNPP